MYYTLAEGIEFDEGTECREVKRFTVCWEGFVFVKGQKPGRSSIAKFIEEIGESNLHRAISMLSGSFVCFVRDKEIGTWCAFSDGSCATPLFYTEDAVSSSILELAHRNHLGIEDLEPLAVVEFILTGLQFSNKIFFDRIKVLDAQEILKITPGWSIELKHLAHRDPFQKEVPSDLESSFLGIMQQITDSVRGLRLSVDLTGGTDTRLTASILDHFGLEFETSVSGTANHPDVLISEKVARLLSPVCGHHPLVHEVGPSTLWLELDDIVRKVDGLCDAVGAHRLYQLALDREKRGIELVIGSSGGELYKDGGWWRAAFLTPLPIRAKEHFIDKIVDSGLAAWGMHEVPRKLFAKRLLDFSENYLSSVKQRLKEGFLSPTVGKYELADRIFYEYSVRAPRGFGCRMIRRYVPHLDPDLVAIGVHLPMQDRLRHGFYRKILSKVNPELANMPTTRNGMSVARGAKGTVRDVLGIIHWQLSKARTSAKDSPQLYSCLRALPEIEGVLASMKNYDVINSDIRVNEIRDVHLGRLVTLFKAFGPSSRELYHFERED
ncbi:hypothetical protein KAX17_15535 [Candidatus Bipolaricaulota bacterium]|nr:hypothetical protein [Candidatus Bipolaricaulota bacterium]